MKTMIFNTIVLIDFLFFESFLFDCIKNISFFFCFQIVPNVFYFVLYFIDNLFYNIENTFKWCNLLVHNVIDDPLFLF